MTAPTLVPCPGCGGRNTPGLTHCDWCGRSFLSTGRQISARWVRLVASLLFGALVVTVVLLAVMNAGRPTTPRSPSATPTATLLPTQAAKTQLVAPTPAPRTPERTATAAPAPAPSPAPTQEELRAAKVARTGGIGVFLRREPSATAASIIALREGTQVSVLGKEEVTAARVWRLVRDARGLEGWVLADYLEFLSE